MGAVLAGARTQGAGRRHIGECSCLPFVSSQTQGLACSAKSDVSGEDLGTCPGLAPGQEGLLPGSGLFLSTFPGPCVGDRRKELNLLGTWLLYLP